MALVRARRFILSAVAVAAVFGLSGCEFLLARSGPVPIVVAEDTLTVSWDADQASLPGTPTATAYFDVYFRRLGTPSWIHVHRTSGFATTATISLHWLAPTNYEFAVQAVYQNGRTSELHTSTDYSAWPPGGWYIKRVVQ